MSEARERGGPDPNARGEDALELRARQEDPLSDLRHRYAGALMNTFGPPRLVLARGMYDWDGAPKRYRETPADAARRVRELIRSHRHDATVVVQPAPHSPHGASAAMIRAGWEVAESEDTVFHIHVAEGRYEGERTLREHGATPIRYLDRLGVQVGRRRSDRGRPRRGQGMPDVQNEPQAGEETAEEEQRGQPAFAGCHSESRPPSPLVERDRG